MKTVVKVVVALAVMAGLGFGGFAVFEHFDRAGIKKQAARACGTLDTPTGSPTLPTALTIPADQKLLRIVTQGKTTAVYVSTQGKLADVVKVRDTVLASLVAQGYTRKGVDQEPGVEADGQFGGKGQGTIKVKPLCTDRLEIRYTLNG